MANADNLFIVQDGEYILQRKAPAAPYAIIANFEENFTDFKVITSLKLDKALSEEGFAGFMFMMQSEGQGGFLVELNKKNEYRLRQIVNGTYKYITGTSKTGGWLKHNSIHDAGSSNMIEIRKKNRNYDLYFNNNFVQSFSEPAYRSGSLGMIVGPATRCKIDFMYVFTETSPEELSVAASAPSNNSEAAPESSGDMIEMTESLIRMKTQINKLNEENEELRKIISAMKSGDQEKDVTAKNYEKQIKSLQDQVIKKEQTLDSLIRKNNDLLKFKELAGGNENGDLIIILSKNLKAEKEKNAVLEKELAELKTKQDSTSSQKSPVKTARPDSGNVQKDNVKKDSTIFKLPVEN